MSTTVNQGIRINVETNYKEEYSDPEGNHFLFGYKVTIENTNSFPVQLLRRIWFIVDSIAENRQVEGDGVLGLQPVLEPGGIYTYKSACDLKTDYGSMHGYYLFKNLRSEDTFRAEIPEFKLIVPYKFN